MAGIDIISDSTGKEIVAAIQSTDVTQARILEINTAAEAKKNEVLESIPEDYTNLNNDVSELKGDLDKIEEDVYSFNTILPIYKSVSGWKLNASDGLCSSDNAYKLVKFKIIAGKLYNISGSERFQFQGTEAVPSSGTPNRIGITYQSDGYAIAPIGAEYLIISTLEKANVTVKDGEP